MKKYYLAIDIGASSGRHIVGWEEDGAIKTDEVFRFPNGTKVQCGHLVWDIADLFKNVKKGIRRAFAKYPQIESLAIDTWGVDYVLMTKDGALMPCLAYRDSRTNSVIDEVHSIIPFKELYSKTGIQFQPFNTIYQLYEETKRNRLSIATDFLMIPEYLNYLLTGIKKKEYTNATTTGLVNAETGEFDKSIISVLGLPKRLFGKLYAPGTSVGALKPEIAAEVGEQLEVVLCASHDTASAVEGIPMNGNQPYISSGTWSLLGLKVQSAITGENSRKANYSNEGGVGYVRYQKNIMGLWLVQSLQKELCPEKSFSDIVKEAQESEFNDFVDANDTLFLAPESMKAAFDKWFESENIKPEQESDYFRCAFTSLAVSYAEALKELERNTGKRFDELYIVGGGAKNELLNELTAQTCKVQVKALPIEATAIGNLKIQIQRGNENE